MIKALYIALVVFVVSGAWGEVLPEPPHGWAMQENDTWRVSVVSLDTVDVVVVAEGYLEYEGPFLVVALHIEHLGYVSQWATFGSPEEFCRCRFVDAEGFTSEVRAGHMKEEYDLPVEEIRPGDHIKAKLLFAMPTVISVKAILVFGDHDNSEPQFPTPTPPETWLEFDLFSIVALKQATWGNIKAECP